MADEAWSDIENDATVAAYFSMLEIEISGRQYNKSEHRRGLKDIVGRSEGAIEFKHQNISFILKALGEVWIWGYKPACNYQDALLDAVGRWLGRNTGWLERVPVVGKAVGLSEDVPLSWSVPPTLDNAPPPNDLEKALPIARRFDVAGRDARNRTLGRAGEVLVLEHEKYTLRQAGRYDLAEAVVWVADVEGDGAGYDIRSFDPDGRARQVEVKTTNGWNRTPFHMSRNELEVAERLHDTWALVRVHDLTRTVGAFELRPPLVRHVSLMATQFQASFD